MEQPALNPLPAINNLSDGRRARGVSMNNLSPHGVGHGLSPYPAPINNLSDYIRHTRGVSYVVVSYEVQSYGSLHSYHRMDWPYPGAD